MTRRLVRRVATPPPHYVPPPRHHYEPPPPKPRTKLRLARVVVHEDYAEFVLNGFEIEDLDAVKAACAMRWDKADRCWVVHRNDLRFLLEALEDGEFIVRLRRLDE